VVRVVKDSSAASAKVAVSAVRMAEGRRPSVPISN
jgi:hypothetical protein